MSLLTNLQLMNQKICQTAKQLSESEIKCDRGAFFGSILSSLNHIYVADIIWLRRFVTHSQQYSYLNQLPELASYTELDRAVADDLATMIKVRQELDATIINWCQALKPEDLAIDIQYNDTKGNLYCKNLGQLIHHFFNHQTHHRGQISTLFSQQELDLGVTDLLQIIPEQ